MHAAARAQGPRTNSNTSFATEDALRIAGLHTQTDDWLEKNLSFMQSGGYAVADQMLKARGAGK